MSKKMSDGPKKHSDLIIDRVKRIFSKKPTHKGEDKAVYDVREAKSNSYHDTNMKLIKDLKRDA